MDGNSKDETLSIAREYGARIEKQFPGTTEPAIIKDWPAMVAWAISLAKFDWILYIDSDESASSGLVKEIRQIVEESAHVLRGALGVHSFFLSSSKKTVPPAPPDGLTFHYMYQTPNRIIYNGREILHASVYPGYQYRFFNRKSGAKYEGNPHYFLKFDQEKYTPGVLKHPWYVYVDDSDAKVKKLQVLQDALDAKNQSWGQFFKWSVWHKLAGIAKILVKVGILYLRHGFKDTLPPKLELSRVKYKSYLFWYIIQQRSFGRSLEKEIAREKELLEKRT